VREEDRAALSAFVATLPEETAEGGDA
jgi:hypothetical protein